MKKILLVDSLRPIIEKEKNILSRADFKIFTATSGEEALKIHRAEKTDLIVAEIDMPGMGGDRLCSAIRRDDALKNVSIIIICSDNKSSIAQCETCGGNACITKPVKPEELFNKVNMLLNIPERKSLRVLIKVSVKGKFKGNYFFATSQNISASGILLETDVVLSKGDIITCSFFLVSNGITAEGEVARVMRKTSDVWHYGVKFTDFEPRSKILIEEFIKKNRNR